MLFEEYNQYTKKDIVMDVISTIVMILLFFFYWMAVLLLASIFLVNVWHVSLERIGMYAVGLAGVSSLIYVVRLVRKRRRGIH